MKRYLFHLLAASTLLFSAYVISLFVIDPYRILHKPWVRSDYFLHHLDIQAAGVINNVDFDAMILGTCMAENFSPNEASHLFGKTFVNLSAPDSSFGERSVVLNYVLKQKKLSKVIYSLDALSFDGESTGRMASYQFLYDENPWNDIKLYMSNPKDIRYLFCGNHLFSTPCRAGKDLEHLTEWYSKPEHHMRFGGLSEWFQPSNDRRTNNAIASISARIKVMDSNSSRPVDFQQLDASVSKRNKNFSQYLLHIADRNKDVEFYLFFPPYSRLAYTIAAKSDPQRFAKYLATIRFVVKECAKHQNIKVFGFETAEFLDDIANYKDSLHYHPMINSKMLLWMKNGEFELLPSNLENYINRITALDLNYSVKDIAAQIDRHLQAVSKKKE